MNEKIETILKIEDKPEAERALARFAELSEEDQEHALVFIRGMQFQRAIIAGARAESPDSRDGA